MIMGGYDPTLQVPHTLERRKDNWGSKRGARNRRGDEHRRRANETQALKFDLLIQFQQRSHTAVVLIHQILIKERLGTCVV